MQYKVSHHFCYSFWYSPENSKKLNQKTEFVALFQRFFDYALLRPMSYDLIFCQMKGLMKVHNRDKFHQCSICGWQVINFPMLLWQCSIHEMALFGGFLGLPPPNIARFCWTFQQRHKHFLKNFSNFYRNGTHPKSACLVQLTPFFPPEDDQNRKK